MRINVNCSLQKSQTISSNASGWTKGRMEQSPAEKIRGNNAFLLTLLTLNWIHLFKVARQYLLLVLSFYCNRFFFSVVSEFVSSNRLCESISEVYDVRNVPLLIYFSYLFAPRTSEEDWKKKRNKAVRWGGGALCACRPLTKDKIWNRNNFLSCSEGR